MICSFIFVVISIIWSNQVFAAYDETRQKLLEPLRKFEAQRPPRCDSDDLQMAYLVTAQVAHAAEPTTLREDFFFAGIFLEVADSALKHNCLDVADKLY